MDINNSRSIYIGKPSTGTWELIGTITPDLPSSGTFLYKRNGEDLALLVVGGWDGSAKIQDVRAFDITARTWTTLPQYPEVSEA